MLLAVSERALPTHNGPLFPAVGAAGMVLTVTVDVPAGLVHTFIVAVKEYVPAINVVALALTVGFCAVEVKLLGPVQLYVAPVIVLAVSERAVPAHTGPLLPAVGVEGKALTVIVAKPPVVVLLQAVAP